MESAAAAQEDIAMAGLLDRRPSGYRIEPRIPAEGRWRDGAHYHANAAARPRAEVEATNRRIVEEWFEGGDCAGSWTEDLWDFEGRIISVPPRGRSGHIRFRPRRKPASPVVAVVVSRLTNPRSPGNAHPPRSQDADAEPETSTGLPGSAVPSITLAANPIVRWV